MEKPKHDVIYCTVEARKILEKIPELQKNVFILECALFKARPKNIIDEYKKGSSLEKILALSKNGYWKFNRDLEVINFDKMLFHYFFVMSKFVKKDIKYSEIVALDEISNYKLDCVKELCNKLKHNSLFYLRGALRTQKATLDTDKRVYTRVEKPVVHARGQGQEIKVKLKTKNNVIRI